MGKIIILAPGKISRVCRALIYGRPPNRSNASRLQCRDPVLRPPSYIFSSAYWITAETLPSPKTALALRYRRTGVQSW